MVALKEEKYKAIIQKAKRRLTPTQALKDKVDNIINKFLLKINRVIKEKDVPVKPTLVGSYVKNTWLPERLELDVFLVYSSKEILKKKCKEHLNFFKDVFDKWEDRHSQHPYLSGIFQGIRVDIVPSFKIKTPKELFTPVDRTILHTKYVNSKISEYEASEIRLLKKFLQCGNLYGAEIKVKGFSGYASELLIIFYRNFLNLLKESQNWGFKKIIDMEGSWKDEKALSEKFQSPLILIDPVDPNRNVTAALSFENYLKFIKRAKEFLLNPSIKYFTLKKTTSLPFREIKEYLNNFIFIITKVPRIPLDNLWGQILKSSKGLTKFLKLNDFKISLSDVWTNEKDLLIFIFRLEAINRSEFLKIIGPEVGGLGEVKFLEKYQKHKGDIKGPFREGNRWYILRKRHPTNIKDFLKMKIVEGDFDGISLGRYIKKALKEKIEIISNSEIEKIYNNQPEFARFLTQIVGKDKI
ncbi:MAG: CCA tRNA nucleotidyltransferase [Candidatus Odinarchaeia archaeon]